MPKDNKRGDTVASPRSSSRVEKKNIVKKGEQHQQEFIAKIHEFFGKGENVSIMHCDEVPEVVLDFEKKDKKKLN